MTKVHVVCGGSSAEREVSLRSGDAVARALVDAGYEVKKLDLATANIAEIVACDVVFPVLHGAGGEDGVLQAELEKQNVRYVGSDARASAICFDKWDYRQLVAATGLPMAPADIVTDYAAYLNHHLALSPHILKPVRGGSSIDTLIVRDVRHRPGAAIQETLARYPSMLLEKLVEGAELTVGILGDSALPVIEIIPPEQGEFDYENKYNGATQELCPPKNVSPATQKAAQALALKAHQLTGCRDFSRTDIMCDKNGNLFLLETNTIPGMTGQSLFPKMAATAGIDMPQLCGQLVEMALRRQTGFASA